MPPAAGTKYALVVSFGSECCGTDHRAASDALDHIAARYPAEALGARRGRWGKEGEFEACFTVAGLKPADRARFVQQVKADVTGKLVSVRENTTCLNERR